jgi:hypothetical protein
LVAPGHSIRINPLLPVHDKMLNKATKFIADVVKTGVERGIYAASAYGCQSSLKRHECRAPLPLTKVFGPLELFIRKELERCVYNGSN